MPCYAFTVKIERKGREKGLMFFLKISMTRPSILINYVQTKINNIFNIDLYAAK
jgi:hypothetical protein